MKVFVLIAAVLIASSSALDTPEYTLANKNFQKFQAAFAALANKALDTFNTNLNNEYVYLRELSAEVLSTVKAIDNPKLTADVTALINSIGVKIDENFDDETITKNLTAPYQALYEKWYHQIDVNVASMKNFSPSVTLSCLKTAQLSINSNITDLTKRFSSRVNQQLSAIQARFTAMNTAITKSVTVLENNIKSKCGQDLVCFAQKVEKALPSIRAKADDYIKQNVAAFASDVAVSATNADELDGIYNKGFHAILQVLFKC